MEIPELDRRLSHKSFYFRGSYIYPLIRQELLLPYLQEYRKQFAGEKNKFKDKAKKLLSVFRNVLLLTTQSRVKQYNSLFIDPSSSRRYVKDQKAYSIHSDFIIEKFPSSETLMMELPSREAVRPLGIATPNIFYPDLAFMGLFLRALFTRARYRETDKMITELEKFGIRLKARDVNRVLKRFRLYSNWAERFLKRVDPQHIFMICSYSYTQMAMIRASKKRNIPVIELQHGYVTKKHNSYMYGQLENRELLPDYFFAYGKYFSDIMKSNSVMFDPQHVFDTGNLSLEALSVENPEVDNELLKLSGGRKIVLITSQITIREVLKELTLSLIDSGKDELFFIFKSHPGEYDASEYYSELLGKANCLLLTDTRYTSLDLLRVSDIHLTVYSSVFMEAYYFGVPTVFYFVESFSDYILEYVDDSIYFLNRSPEELLLTLQELTRNEGGAIENKFEFYKSDPWASFCSALESIKQ
ncbi:MAG: UDP-N-acetyl glucosamine 2-epimerase [Bacteroidetes bacterium]|nr:UDP-N-acetyl glucosamine 2-epimerase [Bacteroidota bacterium]